METMDFPPLTIKKNFLASPCSIFNAWVTPFFTELWLFKNETNQITYRGNAQAGDGFSLMESDQGIEIEHFGKYVCIENNKRLSFRLSAPKHFEGESEVSIDFVNTGFGCEMVFSQRNIESSIMEPAWHKMFATLETTVQKAYQVTDSSSPDDIIAAIEVLIMQMVGLARPLSPEELNKSTSIGGWTAGELLNHVQKYLVFIGETLQLPGKAVQRNPTASAVYFRQTFLDQTLKMSSPGMLVPDQSKFEASGIFAEFDHVLSPLKTQAAGVELNEELSGLPMGPVTKIEILLFTFYHSQRHLWQLAKITDLIRAGSFLDT